jgi:hypothetical protein
MENTQKTMQSAEPLVFTTTNFFCKTKYPVSTRKNVMSEEFVTTYGSNFNEKTHAQREFQDPYQLKSAISQIQEKIEKHKKLVKDQQIAAKMLAEIEAQMEEAKLNEQQENDILAFLSKDQEDLESGELTIRYEDDDAEFVKTKINKARLDAFNH